MSARLTDTQKRLLRLDSEGSDARAKLEAVMTSPNRIRDYDFMINHFHEHMLTKYGENSKKFDAAGALLPYELAISIDQRVTEQVLEHSFLRSKFVNFDEPIFYEFGGIPLGTLTYEIAQVQASGRDQTIGGGKKPVAAPVPNEMKMLQASASMIRRPVVEFERGFYLRIQDLEAAALKNIPLQNVLQKMVIRDLSLDEQYFAFLNDTPQVAEEKGLLKNTAIDSTITASVNWETATAGQQIIDDVVRIKGEILKKTKGAFIGTYSLSDYVTSLPVSIIVSQYNANILSRTYSAVVPEPTLVGLTNRDFRIGALTDSIIDNDTALFYFNRPEYVEISTCALAQPMPQSYDATTGYKLPFRTITAGLTVKVPAAVYIVKGIGS